MAHEKLIHNGFKINEGGQAVNEVRTSLRSTGSAVHTALATEAAVAQAIATALSAADTLSEMSDATISSVAAGHVLIWDGSDSWDNKAISGDVSLDAAGATVVSSLDGKSVSLAGSLTTTGAFSLELTATGNTVVTLPTSGTLATLAGTESLTNKTINGMSITDSGTTLLLEGSTSNASLAVDGALTADASGTGFSISGGDVASRTLTVTGNATVDQNLATTAAPTFSGLTLSGVSDGFVSVSSGVIGSQASIGYSDIASGDIETTLLGTAGKFASADAIKAYVDDQATLSITYRTPVDLVFNSAVASLPATTGTQIDGVTVVDAMRVLVLDSATAGEDFKIYSASVAGSDITWSIEQDGTGADDPADGHTLWAKTGTEFGDSRWTFNGTAWVQTAGGGTYSGGNGIDITGSTISVDFNSANMKFTGAELDTIQDIGTGAAPTFAGMTVSGLSDAIVKVNASGVLGEAVAGTDYQAPVTWGDGLAYSAGTASVDIDTDNLDFVAGALTTIQDIGTLATPTFAGLTLTGAIDATAGAFVINVDDNIAQAFRINTTGKIGIIDIDTTDGAEVLKTSADLNVAGATIVTGGLQDANVTTSIALGDGANTALDAAFAATSMVGALNELKGLAKTLADKVTISASATNTPVSTLDIGTAGGAVWEYSVTINGNMRSGVIRAVSDGTSVEKYEDTTSPLNGATTDIEFDVVLSGGDLRLVVSNGNATNGAVVTAKGEALSVVA